MKKLTLPLSMARNAVLSILLLAVAGFANLHAQPQGAINGLFSVSECRQVYFSQGNLQYQASTGTWRFAPNQYTYVGNGNNNASATYSGWIDKFYWGTSGHNHGAVCYQPWSNSSDESNYYAYGGEFYNLYDLTGMADWGYNTISNGGNQENSGWRTLSKKEWMYVLYLRDGLRCAPARVNGVRGLILLPDNWSTSYYDLNNLNVLNLNYSYTNTISNWADLESHGAVFLPINNADGYSTSSYGGSLWLLVELMDDSYSFIWPSRGSYKGYVRLVQNVSYVCATANPEIGGSVTVGGSSVIGQNCALTATAEQGYSFVNWTDNGEVVSTNSTYSFTVNGARTLTANFVYSNVNITNGMLSGQFKVGDNKWVQFSQGNLQYIGSAATPYWKFAEHQWDCLGDYGQSGNSPTENRDLFTWGTSGYNHGASCYYPWDRLGHSAADYYAYGQSNYNLNDSTRKADWGYNAIGNGGNLEHVGWHTLTHEEWDYVFNIRNTSSGIRYAKASVNNVNGMILLPDDWNSSYYDLFDADQSDASYSSNVISATQWNVLEQHGAVFLPFDRYSSASYRDASTVYVINIGSNSFNPNAWVTRSTACSVRLAFSENYSFPPTINAVPNPTEGGQVNGGGVCIGGNACTLSATANDGYTFINWTEDGKVVSTNATYSFEATSDRTLVANFAYSNVSNTNGALSGCFTVGSNMNRVQFSQGNLQYIGNDEMPYWKFAEHQWDYLGDNGQDGNSPIMNRDLFGWGTSGYNHNTSCYQPWSLFSEIDGNYYAYNGACNNLFDQSGKADWGYNAIYNGGNQENNGWHTLKLTEWRYILFSRNTTSGIRYAKACVNNVNGVVLLPDEWNASYYPLVSTNQSTANYDSNVITASEWETLEQHGAVFLPAAGYRSETMNSIGQRGDYWSSDIEYYYEECTRQVGLIEFTSNTCSSSVASMDNGFPRGSGLSVRLVRDAPCIISVTSNPEGGGAFSGVGYYEQGAIATVTATANTGFAFVNWMEDGSVVSTSASYSFTVTDSRSLVANFRNVNANITNGALSGDFSVGNSRIIRFSQGNLQYIGSATTPYWKFAEHQWDYLGTVQSGGSQNVNRDLFGWGTSGYNHNTLYYQPWEIGPGNYYAYGQPSLNLYDGSGRADWGYNAISNGGNQVNSGWRTPTREEWVYLFNTRYTTSGVRYARACVNNINGVILLPDDWTTSFYPLDNPNVADAAYENNIISGVQWNILEQHGAVFLPTAGERFGLDFSGFSTNGYYWSASSCGYSASCFEFSPYGTWPADEYCEDLYLGHSVRLIRTVLGISATPNPMQGGSVNGSGSYVEGEICTLTATPNAGYVFTNWTENGNVVSTSAYYSFTVTANRTLVANFRNANAGITNGMLNGHFSVGDYEQIQFSQGNLQYIGSVTPRYWKFAEHQWDCFGDNGQGSTSTTANRDLFGWGTSGYNHRASCYQPWSVSEEFTDYVNYYAYGQPTYNLYDQTGQADWGYNAISNGGNQENSGWRTPTKEEWAYLFNTRNTVSGIRFTKARVNNINGIILLPDEWNASNYPLNNTNIGNAVFECNIINATQWNVLEQHGAVFLPTSGDRYWTEVYGVGSDGGYWSSSCAEDEMYTSCVTFGDSGLFPNSEWLRTDGLSVRLVRPAQNYYYGINAIPSPSEGGTVSGGGGYMEGEVCTLTATPNPGYIFTNWTWGSTEVSTDATYSFTVFGNQTLVANFEPITNHWTTTNFKNYKIVKGVIFIDGEEQFSDVLEIGAFCGEECRATSLASFFPVTNQYIVNLNIGSNLDSPNESIVFRIYDHAQHQELNLESNNNLVLTNFNPIGSLNNWFHFSFTQEMAVSVSITPEGAGIITGIGNFFSGTVVTLEAMANNGFSFKRWSMGGQVVSMENPYSFTITEPVELTAEFDYQQIDQLAVGWNWWSTFIEMNGIDGLTMLEGSLGHDGEMIVGQGVNVENYYSQIGYDYWWGDVFQIQNEKGYKISVSSPCEITMTGAKCNQEDHPVTINQNWNWIGYPCINQQSITSVSLQASNEDMIVGQGPISTYYEGYGWWPDFVLEPGKAYLYYSTSESTKEMVFLNNSKESLLKTNTNSTKHNTQLYPDVICVFAKVYLYGEEIKDETIELGAFVGDECRGSVRLMYFEPRDSFYAAFTVFGQDNEVVKFRIVNSEGDLTSKDCPSNILFKANSIFGSLSNPMQLRFGATEEQQIMRGVQVYPNPVGKNNDYCIVIPSDETMTETIIYNSFGVGVGHEYGAIDISSMKALSVSGIYMIEVRCLSGNIYRNKLIVK